MGKARYGTGSVRERRKGVWQVRLSAGTDPVTGERIIVTETVYGLKKDANDRLDALRLEHQQDSRGTNATVDQLAAEWRKHLAVAAQTRPLYELALDRDILPILGKRPVKKLTTLDVQRAYTTLAADGRSPHTIRKAHAVLSKMLNDACQWGWATRNVAANVKLPDVPEPDSTAVEPEVVLRLLAAAQARSALHGLWLHLHVVTGGRRQEVLGLRWCDVDLVGDSAAAGYLTFAQVLERKTGTGVQARAGTKTGKGRRIPIGAATVQMLTDRYAACHRALDGDPPASGYVISTIPDGSKPWNPDTASRWFAELCGDAKVEGVRLHDLRHTAISTVIAVTGDLFLASKMAGHSRTGFTGDRYGHVMARQLSAAADALGGLVNPATPGG